MILLGFHCEVCFMWIYRVFRLGSCVASGLRKRVRGSLGLSRLVSGLWLDVLRYRLLTMGIIWFRCYRQDFAVAAMFP